MGSSRRAGVVAQHRPSGSRRGAAPANRTRQRSSGPPERRDRRPNRRPQDDNRADLLASVEKDPAPGLVALPDAKAIGWVGLGPRDDFGRLARSRTIPELPGDGVWAVNCFVVTRAARRCGVAGALLDAAVMYAREHGAVTLEGYPVETGGERMSSASAYTGTTGMFDRAGFVPAAPTSSKAQGGRPRIVVRREL